MSPTSRTGPLLRLTDPGLHIQTDFDLTMKTSMRMQSTAAMHVEVDSPTALRKLLREAHAEDVPAFILGGGRNTLFATSYFDGVVFQLGKSFSGVEHLGGKLIRVGSGTQLPKLLASVKECELMGLEFLTMVPGTVGGALAGNAGAGEFGVCDFVERVYLMTRDGFIACVDRNQFRYAYRFSELKEAVVLEADFRLEPFDRTESERRINKYREKKVNQPYHVPSSGCIFKNPTLENGSTISAGKLIDECGLKGYQIRSAQVSESHANFIVNNGRSRGEDFLALISLIRDIVEQKTGKLLQVEVQIVGGPLNSAIMG